MKLPESLLTPEDFDRRLQRGSLFRLTAVPGELSDKKLDSKPKFAAVLSRDTTTTAAEILGAFTTSRLDTWRALKYQDHFLDLALSDYPSVFTEPTALNLHQIIPFERVRLYGRYRRSDLVFQGTLTGGDLRRVELIIQSSRQFSLAQKRRILP